MANTQEALKSPNKALMSIVTVLYLTANLTFLITILLNLPVLIDTINFVRLKSLVQLFDKIYFHCNMWAAFVQFACIIAMYAVWGTRGFPSTLSLITSIYNFAMCTGFAVIIYVVDMKNLYFSFQILLVIPIITIFLSGVFLLDDTFDLIRNRFRSKMLLPEEKPKVQKNQKASKKPKKSKKSKKGELQIAELPSEDTLINPTEAMYMQQNVISRAAEKAIPDIKH